MHKLLFKHDKLEVRHLRIFCVSTVLTAEFRLRTVFTGETDHEGRVIAVHTGLAKHKPRKRQQLGARFKNRIVGLPAGGRPASDISELFLGFRAVK